MSYTTYILDTSVLLHDVERWFSLSEFNCQVGSKLFNDLVTDQFRWMNCLGFLPTELIPRRARVVYAMDLKTVLPSGKYGYWRHDELAKIPKKRKKRNLDTGEMQVQYITYKDGREPNPQDKYSKDRVTQNRYYLLERKLATYAAVKKCWYEFARREGLEVYQMEGYEADDCAAAYVQLADFRRETILLCTIDQDWIGLVSSNVSWFDVKGYQNPRLINWSNYREWGTSKGYNLSQPSDIWKVKATEGDRSDSLPAGTPIEYIHLLEPPMEHRLWMDNRLPICNKGVVNLCDYRGIENHLLESSVQNVAGECCQVGTFYATMRG